MTNPPPPPTATAPGGQRRIVLNSQQDQIRFLREMCTKYRGNQLLVDKARDIVFRWGRCPPKNKLLHAVTIARWVQEQVTYVNEPIETFATPLRILTNRIGDCDDFTVLIVCLCEAVGVEAELVGVQWDGQFRHIFARARIGSARIPLDATLNQDVRTLPNPLTIALRAGKQPTIFAL